MKIGSRILLGFGSIVLLLLIVAIMVTVGNLRTIFNVDSINRYNELQIASNNVMDIYNETRMSARFLYQGPSDSAYADYTKQSMYVENRLATITAMIQSNVAFTEFEQDAAQFSSLYLDWCKKIEALQQAYQSNADSETVVALAADARTLDLRTREVIGNIILNVGDRAARKLKDTKVSGLTSLIAALVISAMALVLALVLASKIVSSITKPLWRIQSALTQMGRQGDFKLSADIFDAIQQDAEGKDEVADCAAAAILLLEHLNTFSQSLISVADGDLTTMVTLQSEKDSIGAALLQMLDNLNQKFTTIRVSAQQVHGTSRQLDAGFQDLYSVADQQAQEVLKLSDSIEKVAEQTKVNTKKAGEAAKLAGTIRQNASMGSDQMSQMMSAVTEINDANQSISNIIKVINDIAFQTNILSLNAAVEAARAGENGKGFAVVANEVRNLAAKSAEAAKNTGVLIENSIKKALYGVEIAEKTSQSLDAIVSGIQKSSEIMEEIATSSSDQANAVQQINDGVSQVTEVARQTSEIAGNSATASEAISGQAAVLENLVDQFQLKNSKALS
ncbi:methyl-accepting chemotaxis protein [Lachnospiraceae bacterium ZAX-1]